MSTLGEILFFFFFLSLESMCGGHSQPVCWKHISRDGQSPMRACHLPQGCRTLIFSLKVSPDDEIVLLANTECDSILVLPNRSPAVCSGPFAFSLAPPAPYRHNHPSEEATVGF